MRALAPATLALVALLGACADPQPPVSEGSAGGLCTACHGDGSRLATELNPELPAAPPVAPRGKPDSVVGAHQDHLNDNPVRGAVSCNNCHVVPTDGVHAAGNLPVVVFTPGTLATAQGAAPTFDGAALTCSSTYCHGSFTYGSVTGNATPSPAWNSTAAIACTGCHGMPPAGHPPLGGTPTAAACSVCHPATVRQDGTIDVAGGKHIDGEAQFQGGHDDPSWAAPTHHGYQASAQGLQGCTGCHVGFGAAGGAPGSSCNDCHSGGTTAWQTNCTFCHGTPGRTGEQAGTDPLLSAAPPVGTQGEGAATEAAVGAHRAHVNPAASGAVTRPIGCATCHPTPLPADVAHVDGQPTPVQFSGLAVSGGATPTYDRGASPTCSSTYCHGSFAYGAVTGNATPSPAWNGGTPLGCTGCHGMPPTGHPALGGTVTAATCSACHPATVMADGTLDVAGGKHVNGQAEVASGHPAGWWSPDQHGYQASAQGLQTCTGCHVGFGSVSGLPGSSCNGCHSGGTTAWQTSCTFCHGTAGRTGEQAGTDPLLSAAPPVGTQGEAAATEVAVGAHQAHVNPAASGAVTTPIACAVCHPSPLPADVAHVDGQPAPVQFSGLAVSGGATPTYDRGASPTCSSTYCHGSFTYGAVTGNAAPSPAWNGGAGLDCTGCHGMPPTGHFSFGGLPTPATCAVCHTTTLRPDGTIDVAGGRHMNGRADSYLTP
jgi:predicted CxxxxCH...CXXCH cytochrome family protein